MFNASNSLNLMRSFHLSYSLFSHSHSVQNFKAVTARAMDMKIKSITPVSSVAKSEHEDFSKRKFSEYQKKIDFQVEGRHLKFKESFENFLDQYVTSRLRIDGENKTAKQLYVETKTKKIHDFKTFVNHQLFEHEDRLNFFNKCDFTDPDIYYLLLQTVQKQSLKHLFFSYKTFGTISDVDALLKNCNPGIQSLSIGSVRHQMKLTAIHKGFLTDDCLTGICNLTLLKHLDISTTWITRGLLQMIISKCSSLEELIVNACPYINDDSLQWILQNSPKLNFIQLNGCYLDEKKVQQLRKSFPKVEISFDPTVKESDMVKLYEGKDISTL